MVKFTLFGNSCEVCVPSGKKSRSGFCFADGLSILVLDRSATFSSKLKVKKIAHHHLNTPPRNPCATKEQSTIVLKIMVTLISLAQHRH